MWESGYMQGNAVILRKKETLSARFQVLSIGTWLSGVSYLPDLERPAAPVAQGARGVLRAPRRCFPEYRGFQVCPVAPVDLGDLGGREAPVRFFSSLQREKTNEVSFNAK